jgi:hypothetical protein
LKPFLFSKGQRNYARFLVPVAARHLADGKKYLVFSLGAGEPPIIRQRATYLEAMLLARVSKGEQMSQERDKIRKYEIDLSRGIFKAEGKEDHGMMLETLGRLPEHMIRRIEQEVGTRATAPGVASPEGPHVVENEHSRSEQPATQSLPLVELLDKFFLLKKVKPSTVTTYKNVVNEFTTFCKREA